MEYRYLASKAKLQREKDTFYMSDEFCNRAIAEIRKQNKEKEG